MPTTVRGDTSSIWTVHEHDSPAGTFGPFHQLLGSTWQLRRVLVMNLDCTPTMMSGELPKNVPVRQATSSDLALRQAIVDKVQPFVHMSLAQTRVYDVQLAEWPALPFEQAVRPSQSFHVNDNH